MLFFVGYSQNVKISSLQTKQANLQAEKKKYSTVVAKIKKLKEKQDLLQAKLTAIEKLKANSHLSVRVLAELANLTPSNRMWLKSLKMANGSVSLAGVALDNATIAQYMERIKKSPFFSNAELQSSSMTKVADQKLKAFTLSLKQIQP